METLITYSFHIPGTLVANVAPLVAVPSEPAFAAPTGVCGRWTNPAAP